ncbi:MAG: bacteriohemerythrin [candidate division Zixibacteria bacterium]|nr:bacteriohemerythrin [candidate division Zixibacteria bacterium]
MARVQWCEAFEVDIPEVDEQHKKLVAMINQLDESMKDGIVNETIGTVLIALVDYTGYHFDTEEKVMQEVCFEGYLEHKGMHERLKGEIAGLLRRMKAGESVNVFELTSFLADWLVNHIIKEDRKIGEAYMAAHAFSQATQ